MIGNIVGMLLLYSSYVSGFQGLFIEMDSHTRYAENVIKVLNESKGAISNTCEEHLWKYARDLLSNEVWALKMFDSNSKVPSGFLDGHFTNLGSFDECINSKGQLSASENIFGKYCIAEIPVQLSNVDTSEKFVKVLKNLSNGNVGSKYKIRFSICMPDACSAQDIQEVYQGINLPMNFVERLCQTEYSQAKLDNTAFMGIAFFGIIIGMICASTSYELALLYCKKKPASPLLVSFSIVTNGKRLIQLSNNPNQISSLHGIRVLAIMWIAYFHSFHTTRNFTPTSNYFESQYWYKSKGNMLMINVAHAVDTFFVIGGLLVSYNYMSAAQKGLKFNIVIYYLRRYIRLTPVLIALIIFTVTLLRHVGSGPLWSNYVEDGEAGPCEVNWWKALLYIQNYIPPDNSLCLSVSWYLSVDFQLYLLSPIILLPLNRWPKATLTCIALLIICSAASTFIISWIYELGIRSYINRTPLQYLIYEQYYYNGTSVRAVPWLVGVLFGYVIFKCKQTNNPPHLNKVTTVALWIASICTACACTFAAHNLILEYERIGSSIQMSLVNVAWGISIGSMVFGCTFNYGGIINWFLGLPIFEVLSKLTYTFYMVHCSVMIFVRFQMRETTTSTNLQTIYEFWGDIMLSLIASIFLTMALEMPMLTIEKLIFKKWEGNGNKKTNHIIQMNKKDQEEIEVEAAYKPTVYATT